MRADLSPIDLESISPDVAISQKFIYYWQGVVYRIFPGPYLYRVLVPHLYFVINRITHLPLVDIDLFTKTLILVFCQFMLYVYFKQFVRPVLSLLGVVLFDSFLGYFLSFIKGPSIIESMDLLNLGLFTAGLYLIFKERYWALSIVLVFGILNRETPILLVPLAMAYEFNNGKKIRESLIPMVVAVIVFLGLRFGISGWAITSWFNINELARNIAFATQEAFSGNIRLLVLIIPFVLIGIFRFHDHPKLIKFALWLVPALILIHYFTARIIESRLWMPLLPLLIPPVLANLDLILDETRSASV